MSLESIHLGLSFLHTAEFSFVFRSFKGSPDISIEAVLHTTMLENQVLSPVAFHEAMLHRCEDRREERISGDEAWASFGMNLASRSHSMLLRRSMSRSANHTFWHCVTASAHKNSSYCWRSHRSCSQVRIWRPASQPRAYCTYFFLMIFSRVSIIPTFLNRCTCFHVRRAFKMEHEHLHETISDDLSTQNRGEEKATRGKPELSNADMIVESYVRDRCDRFRELLALREKACELFRLWPCISSCWFMVGLGKSGGRQTFR